ncbi:MAG: KEOPS complex subunit Pcc1 [Candidatus Bathyarchaeota archaeon]|nr:KEOPS complex subunit Pcc1 [Candidatus Bathyarchaeota archaeon]MCX8177596.1 KEOPS complex subunit Pcc1 [Candidatus Bathyarchaeota archaeon]MDW8194304.1 KEOPS complex subunit Pcc1 [Nitrososphaerota archaeon]
MKAKATIQLKFSSKEELKVISAALTPEMEKPPTLRSKAEIKIEDNMLFLTVEARDTVALRASLNAYLRWILAVHNIFSLLNSESKSSA